MSRHIAFFVAAGMAVMTATAPARAESPKVETALAGLHEVKVAFDLTNGNSKALLDQLGVIDQTRRSLIAEGVTPHVVITFRGPATRLVQTDATKIQPEDRVDAAKIAEKIAALRSASGVASLVVSVIDSATVL